MTADPAASQPGETYDGRFEYRRKPTPGRTIGELPAQIGHAHLVGIAGTGVQAFAGWLMAEGWTISGSDVQLGDRWRFGLLGSALYDQHAAENLPAATTLVVHSPAIPEDNSELLEARRLGLQVLSYPQAVGQVMSRGMGLAVAGTHGKSTTTAMLADIFIAAGADPTVFCGAARHYGGWSGRFGQGPLVLAEACEYRRHFLELDPACVALLGIEADHFDYYADLADIEHAFMELVEKVAPSGLIVARQECPVTRRITQELSCRVRTFGLEPNAAWQATRLTGQRGYYQFDIHREGRPWSTIELKVPGQHNVANALAAAALAGELGVGPDVVKVALDEFDGLQRRTEVVGQFGGVTVVDDYAHHPTAVAATLATVREMFPGRRLWCTFEPHQISRTRRLLDELADSLQNADKLVVLDVYKAREAAAHDAELIEELARAVQQRGTDAIAWQQSKRLAAQLPGMLEPDAVVVTMGAGNIRKICDGLVERLRRDRAA